MKYALFLGCTIPARSRHYELSARKVAQKLGVEFVDQEKFICCGFPVKSAEKKSALILAAYNLALAEKDNLDLCSLCSSCTSALTEAAHQLSEHERDRADVNQTLEKVGLKFEGKVKVRHFARILYEAGLCCRKCIGWCRDLDLDFPITRSLFGSPYGKRQGDQSEMVILDQNTI